MTCKPILKEPGDQIMPMVIYCPDCGELITCETVAPREYRGMCYGCGGTITVEDQRDKIRENTFSVRLY
jgi:hypothetical protein